MGLLEQFGRISRAAKMEFAEVFVYLTIEIETIMAEKTYPCENCKFRAHYDRNPKSALGRFWRWHINFCPGFKAFFTHQDEETKAALRAKYNFKKYQ